MLNKGIKFILIQIDEAHSTKWPIGLINTPEPQKDFAERVERANLFVTKNKPPKPIEVYIDGWDNLFGDKFQAWPDKYYCIDSNYKIIHKATYGSKSDALIDMECTELINLL